MLIKNIRRWRDINLLRSDFSSSSRKCRENVLISYSSSSNTGSFLMLPLVFFLRPSLDPSFFHADTSLGALPLLLHGLSRLCCGVPGGVMTVDILEAGPPLSKYVLPALDALSSFTENKLIGLPLLGVYIDAGGALFEDDRL